MSDIEALELLWREINRTPHTVDSPPWEKLVEAHKTIRDALEQKRGPEVVANLKIMGAITTKEPDGDDQFFPFGLLLSFDDPEQIRAALDKMECRFTFPAAPSPDSDSQGS